MRRRRKEAEKDCELHEKKCRHKKSNKKQGACHLPMDAQAVILSREKRVVHKFGGKRCMRWVLEGGTIEVRKTL